METDADMVMDSTIQRGDPGPLVEALRKSTLQKIEEINSAADREIRDLDQQILRETSEFRELQRAIHENMVKNESVKIRNLSSTSLKKQKLEGVESFIQKVIDDAVNCIRKESRYGDFLNSCVLSGLDNVKGNRATILLSDEDLRYSGSINDAINRKGYTLVTCISTDDRVKSGGAMVIDDEAEVIYNNTVERIVYRKKEEIRRVIVRSLKEPGECGEG